MVIETLQNVLMAVVEWIFARLPLTDGAARTGGRRPGILRARNRGTATLGGVADYGDSGAGGRN